MSDSYLSHMQIIRNGALDQLKNEVDIQTVCGHHPFIVQCKAYWQTHRKICIRKLKFCVFLSLALHVVHYREVSLCGICWLLLT